MKLYKGKPYWPITGDNINYKPLSKDINCDITIIGGGIAGMITAYRLTLEGYKVVLIEKDKIASGSSSANTGLLQFTSDISLYQLSKQIGEKNAYLFYKMCFEAMQMFMDFSTNIKQASNLHTRNSLYLATSEEDLKLLKLEYNMLEKYGFPVKYLTKQDLKLEYNIDAFAAILTFKDAEVNPVRLIHALAQDADSKYLTIYENTEALDLKHQDSSILIKTENGQIKSKYVVITTGYAAVANNSNIKSDLKHTFAIATNPVQTLPWMDKSLLWETKRPYLYTRLTDDNRIIAGGLDVDFNEQVLSEQNIFDQGQLLLKELQELVPSLDTQVQYAWGAVFGESKDNLPFIGNDGKHKNIFYNLGFGGNGTVYSMAGARIIGDLINEKSNPFVHIVKPDR